MLFCRLTLPMNFAVIYPEILGLLEGDWLNHVNTRGYDGKWDVIALRALTEYKDKHPILQTFAIQNDGSWCDLDIMDECPELQSWLSSFACPLKSIRLMRLAAGSQIKPHRDNGLEWESGEARLHVPIITAPEVAFFVKGQPVPMKAGELWYINAGAEHEVINNSSIDRVHLVIDCELNDWLVRQFQDESTAAIYE